MVPVGKSLVVERHLMPRTETFSKVIHGIWNPERDTREETEAVARKATEEFCNKFPEFNSADWTYTWVDRYQ